METFEYYVQKGDVRKEDINLERVKSLIKDSKTRVSNIEELDIQKFSKIIFENIYDAVRDLCDAILLLDGWKSYSHEASISYLSKKGFDFVTISQLDVFRYKRNGSKYYGEIISLEEAKNIKAFYSLIKDKLYRLLNNKKLG